MEKGDHEISVPSQSHENCGDETANDLGEKSATQLKKEAKNKAKLEKFQSKQEKVKAQPAPQTKQEDKAKGKKDRTIITYDIPHRPGKDAHQAR